MAEGIAVPLSVFLCVVDARSSPLFYLVSVLTDFQIGLYYQRLIMNVGLIKIILNFPSKSIDFSALHKILSKTLWL